MIIPAAFPHRIQKPSDPGFFLLNFSVLFPAEALGVKVPVKPPRCWGCSAHPTLQPEQGAVLGVGAEQREEGGTPPGSPSPAVQDPAPEGGVCPGKGLQPAEDGLTLELCQTEIQAC